MCECITYQSGWGPKGLRYSYLIRTFHQTNLWNPSLQTQFVEASGQAKMPLSFLYQALVVIEWIHFLPILSFDSWIRKLMYPSLHCLYCSHYRYFLSLEHVDQNRVYLLFDARLGRLMLRIQLPWGFFVYTYFTHVNCYLCTFVTHVMHKLYLFFQDLHLTCENCRIMMPFSP